MGAPFHVTFFVLYFNKTMSLRTLEWRGVLGNGTGRGALPGVSVFTAKETHRPSEGRLYVVYLLSFCPDSCLQVSLHPIQQISLFMAAFHLLPSFLSIVGGASEVCDAC